VGKKEGRNNGRKERRKGGTVKKQVREGTEGEEGGRKDS
jgi:hypothetical protein